MVANMKILMTSVSAGVEAKTMLSTKKSDIMMKNNVTPRNASPLLLRLSALIAAAQIFMAIGIMPMNHLGMFHQLGGDGDVSYNSILDGGRGGVPNKATWKEDTSIRRNLDEKQQQPLLRAAGSSSSGTSPLSLLNNNNKKQCNCVHCDTDEQCGGLWTGSVTPNRGDPKKLEKIHLLVSHCLHNLHWMTNFTKGYDISSVTVVSKCGKDVIGAPQGSKIIRLDNVGRCDHTYAYYLSHLPNYQHNLDAPTEHTPIDSGDDKEIHVFLKDDRDETSIHQPGSWRSLQDMLRIASERGFVCGMRPSGFWTRQNKRKRVLLSAYHKTQRLSKFSLQKYESKVGRKKQAKYAALQSESDKKEEQPFQSEYKNFSEWQNAIPLELPHPVTEVCYGGSFASTTKNIKRQPLHVWQSMEQSLSRADNLEEGHFAERSWAGLMANPIKEYQIEALKEYSTEEVFVRNSICGAFAIPRNLRVMKAKLREKKEALEREDGEFLQELQEAEDSMS